MLSESEPCGTRAKTRRASKGSECVSVDKGVSEGVGAYAGEGVCGGVGADEGDGGKGRDQRYGRMRLNASRKVKVPTKARMTARN